MYVVLIEENTPLRDNGVTNKAADVGRFGTNSLIDLHHVVRARYTPTRQLALKNLMVIQLLWYR